MRGLTISEHALVGAVCILLTLALMVVGLRAVAGEFDTAYEVTATFPTVGQGLDTFSDVRIRGVPVGTVEDIALDEDGQAQVTLQLPPEVTIPEDATASIEPLSIFGPAFVALDVGTGPSAGPHLGDGDEVAAAPRRADLDDLLVHTSQLLEQIDPDELGWVMRTSASVAGDLAPRSQELVDAAEQLSAVAARNTERGTALLGDLDRLADELGGTGTTVQGLSADAGALLPELVASEQRLATTFDASARLAQLSAELLDRHPDALTQLAQGLLPSLLPPLAAVAGSIEVVPDFVDVLAAFFGALSGVMHLDAPDGEGRLGGIEMLLRPLDVCEFLDICALEES